MSEKSIPKEDIMDTLKVVSSFLEAYKNLIREMAKFQGEYGILLKDAIDNLTSPDILERLVETLPPMQLGKLIVTVTKFSRLNPDFQNFMAYDDQQLKVFANKLESINSELQAVLKEAQRN